MESVVIVALNEASHIGRCLASVNKPGRQVIVLDNGSTDRTSRIVEESVLQTTSVKNKRNLGVAKARNQGLRLAHDTRYTILLDADTEVPPDTFENIISFMEQNPRVGIVGPKLEYTSGQLQYSCRRFPTLWEILLRGLGITESHRKMGRYLMRDYDHEVHRPVDWVMGACQVIRREMLDQIGLLDEKYFFGYEDVDLCWRAWKNGWQVVYLPEATVIHHYQRRSAQGGIFNKLKWSHFFSAMRFLIKKNFYD